MYPMDGLKLAGKGESHLKFATDLEADKQRGFLPTGMGELDRLLGGGFPLGSLVEVYGSVSSGRTGFILKILAEAASRGEFVAYIDAFDFLDPLFAESSGILLNRLLWVRCADKSPMKGAHTALKAADVIARSGGFGAAVIDLAFERRSDRQPRLPGHTWFRLQRAVEGSSTVLLALLDRPCAGSAASITLATSRRNTQWERSETAGGQISLATGSAKAECPSSNGSRWAGFGPSDDSSADDDNFRLPFLSSATPLLSGIGSKIELIRGGGYETDSVALHCAF